VTESNRGEIIDPRIFSCGPLLDGTPHSWPGSVAIDSPAEARRVVHRLIADEQVDALIATQRVRPSVLRAVVETAHGADVPVTGQVWLISAADGAAIGIAGLENTARIPEVRVTSARRPINPIHGPADASRRATFN
jgi:hypothetical protein